MGGAYTHFVKWDSKKDGGRWFECSILSSAGQGKMKVHAHDGDERERVKSEIVPIDQSNVIEVGDRVIAYWDGRAYAFAGKVQKEEPDRFYIIFDDGDKGWKDATKVYKLVAME